AGAGHPSRRARDRGARQPGRLPHAGAAVDQSRCGGRALHVPRGARRRHGGLRVLAALAGAARAELYVHAAALSRVVPALVRRLAAAAGHRAHRRRRVLSAVFAGHRLRGVGPLLLVVHGAIALGFLTLTFPIQFAEHGTTIAWSVEGAALVWGGLRLRSGPLRIGGLIVLALGMARWLMIVADQPAHRGMFVADDPALVSTLVYIVATAIAARRYRTEGVRLTEPETYVRPTLAAVSAAAAGLFLATELHRHPALMSSALRSVTTTLVWLAVATLLLSLVRSDRTATLVVVSGVMLAMVGLKAALIDTAVWQSLTPAPPPLLN